MKNLILISILFSVQVSAHTVRYFEGVPLEIITIGHPTLGIVADEVLLEEIETPKFQTFLDDLILTMKKAGGVGIAAPQVNVSKRVFIIKPSIFRKAKAIINPKVDYNEAAGKKDSTEGCLSIPGKQYTVERYKEINITYYDRRGKFQAEKAKGFTAVVFQHEYDHLNGILISDFFKLENLGVDFIENIPRM